VAPTVRVLPQSKASNLLLGLALMLVGLAVVFWAFSGEQAYNRNYFYVAILATVLALFGTVLLANSRVVASRKPALASRAAVELVRLQCPKCSAAFEAEGVRPFHATCPSCGARGRVT